MNVEMKTRAFKALGDPTRLRIVEILSCCPEVLEGPTAGEICCEVAGAETINSTVSHHLKELREAGLIHVERQGKTRCCSLNREALKDLVQCLQTFIEGDRNDCC